MSNYEIDPRAVIIMFFVSIIFGFLIKKFKPKFLYGKKTSEKYDKDKYFEFLGALIMICGIIILTALFSRVLYKILYVILLIISKEALKSIKKNKQN